MKIVTIKLTKGQKEKLSDSFEKIRETFKNTPDKKGMLVGQAWENGGASCMKITYLNYEASRKIEKIISEEVKRQRKMTSNPNLLY